MKYADLHVHTNFSDGTFSPEEVVRYASEKDLSCIAICDHDCIDAIGPCLKAAESTSLEIVPGVELTVIEKGREIHMLGYFVDREQEWFRKILLKVQDDRITRVDKMLEKLRKFNIDIKRESVMAIAGNKGSVGRLHLAQAMFKEKAIPSIQAAFDRYIGDFGPCYVEDIGFGAKEAVGIITKAGGVPVLAHPKTLGNDRLVAQIIKCGVRGIEVFHSDHSASDSAKYEKIAKDSNILITGGSDCHGLGKKKILMGTVKIPYTLVEELKKENIKKDVVG